MKSHTYTFSKLVRDGSLQNLSEKGAVVHSHVLDKTAFRRQLTLKLLEEAQELANCTTTQNFREELADVLEVVISLTTAAELSMEDIEQERLAKRSKRGGFEQRLFVESIQCPVGSFWDEYCAKDPEKYPRL